jgi:hypothetical protein
MDISFGRGALWTRFSVDCTNRGIPLTLHAGFFRRFPDWRFAFTREDKKTSVLGADLVLQNALAPLDEKYRPPVQSMFHDVAVICSGLLTKYGTAIDIRQDSLSYTTRGVLKNAGTAWQILALLEKLADRIESERNMKLVSASD